MKRRKFLKMIGLGVLTSMIPFTIRSTGNTAKVRSVADMDQTLQYWDGRSWRFLSEQSSELRNTFRTLYNKCAVHNGMNKDQADRLYYHLLTF